MTQASDWLAFDLDRRGGRRFALCWRLGSSVFSCFSGLCWLVVASGELLYSGAAVRRAGLAVFCLLSLFVLSVGGRLSAAGLRAARGRGDDGRRLASCFLL